MIGGVIVAGGSASDGLAAGDDQQKAAPLGLFVLLLIGVACYFLFKSMSRHLKRVRENFPAPGAAVGTATGRTATDRVRADPVSGDPVRGDPMAGKHSSADSDTEGAGPIPPVAP